jgi:hypothetical protein
MSTNCDGPLIIASWPVAISITRQPGSDRTLTRDLLSFGSAQRGAVRESAGKACPASPVELQSPVALCLSCTHNAVLNHLRVS